MTPPAIWSYVAVLFGFEIFLGAFRFIDFGRGVERAGLLGLVMLLLLSLRYWPDRLTGGTRNNRFWKPAVVGLVALAAMWNLGVMALTVIHTAKTGELRFDQGQAAYRAALEIWRGRDPYAVGALLDPLGYRNRMAKRIAAGIGPTIPASAVNAELDRYWDTLDPAIRERLLPAVTPKASAAVRREAALAGYKYGPAPVLLTAPLAPVLGPVAVPVTTGAACLALFIVVALILGQADAGVIGGGLALGAVMIDPWITVSYVLSSASDIWALLFGFAAVLCALRRWDIPLGICLALALGSKQFPAVLYLPLLITARSVRATVAFGVAVVALFLPWVIWDARGFLYNYAYFFALVDADSTSWVQFAPAGVALLIRLILGVCVAFLTYLYVSGRERRMAWFFAAINLIVVAAGPMFHNNYIPWFSIWVVLAIAEAFYVRGGLAPEAHRAASS